MKKLGAVLILCCCTLVLSSCAVLETGGPCYGVGCPAFATKGAPAAAPAAQAAPAQDSPATATNAAPAQKKHHKFWLF